MKRGEVRNRQQQKYDEQPQSQERDGRTNGSDWQEAKTDKRENRL